MSNAVRRSAVLIVFLPAVALLALASAVQAGDITPGPLAKLTPERREAQVELGRRLFFEPHASPSGRRACSSCHDPDYAYSDPKRLSADDFGITTRHSQTILGSAGNPSAHWDGEFATVAELVTRRISQARSPWQAGPAGPLPLPELRLEPSTELDPKGDWGPLADGTMPTVKTKRVEPMRPLARFIESRLPGARRGFNLQSQLVARRLHSEGRYAEAFEAAFGSRGVTVDRIATSIEAYCKTVEGTLAPVDRFLAGDEAALDASARRGLELFRGRAGCAACHTMKGRTPAFTDYRFHNTGIAWSAAVRDTPAHQVELLGRALRDPRLTRFMRQGRNWSVDAVKGPVQLLADRGRAERSGTPKHARHFKTPTLRDVALRPPYMHDGHLRSLAQVVRYYADGCCKDDPRLDKRLKGFEASEQDVADLVAFLHALTGFERAGLAKTPWSRRAAAVRVKVVDDNRNAMAGVRVTVDPAGDFVPAEGAPTSTMTLRTDDKGEILFTPPAATHARVRLAGDGDPEGGVLVPDTCTEARAVMPVTGRVKFIVEFAADYDVPDVIKWRHRSGFVRRRSGGTLQPSLVSWFRRSGLEKKGDAVEASYEGWVRTTVRAQAELDMPEVTYPGAPNERVRVSHVLTPGRVIRVDLKSHTEK